MTSKIDCPLTGQAYKDVGCVDAQAFAGQPVKCVDCPLPECVEDKDKRSERGHLLIRADYKRGLSVSELVLKYNRKEKTIKEVIG